jgi:hypothetical protein
LRVEVVVSMILIAMDTTEMHSVGRKP